MIMDHRPHIGPGGIDRGVDEALEIGFATLAFDHYAVERQHEDIVSRDGSRANRFGQQETIGPVGMTSADMAKPIEHFLAGKDAVGERKLRANGPERAHGFNPRSA